MPYSGYIVKNMVYGHIVNNMVSGFWYLNLNAYHVPIRAAAGVAKRMGSLLSRGCGNGEGPTASLCRNPL